METKTLLFALIALIVGAAGGYALANNQSASLVDNALVHDAPHTMESETTSMMAALEGKEGDDFDKAFLSEMILHHEGAVAMAEAARSHAKHEEIRSMANAIISAQTSEIEEMREWQRAWYGQ